MSHLATDNNRNLHNRFFAYSRKCLINQNSNNGRQSVNGRPRSRSALSPPGSHTLAPRQQMNPRTHMVRSGEDGQPAATPFCGEQWSYGEASTCVSHMHTHSLTLNPNNHRGLRDDSFVPRHPLRLYVRNGRSGTCYDLSSGPVKGVEYINQNPSPWTGLSNNVVNQENRNANIQVNILQSDCPALKHDDTQFRSQRRLSISSNFSANDENDIKKAVKSANNTQNTNAPVKPDKDIKKNIITDCKVTSVNNYLSNNNSACVEVSPIVNSPQSLTFSHSILNSGGGPIVTEEAECVFHVGACGATPCLPRKAKKHTNNASLRVVDTLPCNYHKVIQSCGCCWVGVPVQRFQKAATDIDRLMGDAVSLNFLKQLYASEECNMGSPNAFVSNDKSLKGDRAKIVNWMSYVCSKLGFQNSVYFLAINLFDLYILRSGKSFTSSDLPPLAASAFLQAANVVEVGNDGKLPTLREFVTAAPWLESTSQILKIQLDMIATLMTMNPSDKHTSRSVRGSSTLVGKTAYDILIIFLSNLKHSAKWKNVWTWLMKSGSLIDLYHRALATADYAAQRGTCLTAPMSVLLAATIVKHLSAHIAPFNQEAAVRDFYSDVFGMKYSDVLEYDDLLQTVLQKTKASRFPVCGDDLGASAPTVVSLLKRLTPEQRTTEKLIRHQYRVFKLPTSQDINRRS